MRGALVEILDRQDRALFARLVLHGDAPALTRAAWVAITHAGGVTGSFLIALVPFVVATGAFKLAAMQTGWILGMSHALVQLVKRNVVRGRPHEVADTTAHVRIPDRYSFPSGHSAASMAVAFGYGATFPSLAAPLLMAAVLVGFSRVRLGVHFPGDVIAGQLIAILTGIIVRAAW
ncbi:MAG: phosphatase PAP2 family protein [Gemmatimonadetes bacterium]|nr:phosphatase PAP2 family protein [Gemmatimonadota bacterium]